MNFGIFYVQRGNRDIALSCCYLPINTGVVWVHHHQGRLEEIPEVLTRFDFFGLLLGIIRLVVPNTIGGRGGGVSNRDLVMYVT